MFTRITWTKQQKRWIKFPDIESLVIIPQWKSITANKSSIKLNKGQILAIKLRRLLIYGVSGPLRDINLALRSQSAVNHGGLERSVTFLSLRCIFEKWFHWILSSCVLSATFFLNLSSLTKNKSCLRYSYGVAKESICRSLLGAVSRWRLPRLVPAIWRKNQLAKQMDDYIKNSSVFKEGLHFQSI